MIEKKGGWDNKGNALFMQGKRKLCAGGCNESAKRQSHTSGYAVPSTGFGPGRTSALPSKLRGWSCRSTRMRLFSRY